MMSAVAPVTRPDRPATGRAAKADMIMTKQTWVVLANSSRARLFELDPDAEHLHEVSDFVHPEGRQKQAELGDEQGGHTQRSLSDGGSGGSAFQARTDARHKERERFARILAEFLDKALAERRFESLVLIASNPFLGELRAHLKDSTDRAVAAILPRDLTGLGTLALTRRVLEAVREIH